MRSRILKNVKLTIIAGFILHLAISLPSFADSVNLQETDTIRAELSNIKDKKSPQYTKAKQKLEKIISQNKIDYSDEARLKDIERLIKEQKFNTATYELNDLIENGTQLGPCYMLLGDISAKSANNPKKTASLYKESLKYNQQNYLATYKLAKLYLRENKNIIGIEYLKQTIQNTNDENILKEIEYIIQNKIMPQDRYDANNLYEALGELYQKQNRKADSYIAFNKAIQINPNDIFLKYYLGDLYFCDCKDKEATSVYDDILKEYPNDTMIRISKAKSLANEGNLLSAEKEFKIILEQNPNSAQAKYGLYKIYERKMPPDKILEKIYSNKKNYTAGQKECLEFADFLEEMNDSKAAENYRKFAAKLDELEKEKQLALIKAKEEQQKLQQKTIKSKQNKTEKTTPKQETIKSKQNKTEKTTPKQETTEIKKTEKQNQISQTQNKKSEQEKQKQISLNEKKQKEYENKIIRQERQKAISKDPKKYNEYKLIIDKYQKLNPKDASIYVAIANTYKLMGEPTSALRNYREAQKFDPTNSDIYYNIGLTYMELNSFISAKANLMKSVNLNKENSKAIKLLAFVNQKIITQIINSAYEKYEKKDYIKSESILNDGLKSYPKNPQMLYYRALVYDAMNRNAAQIIDLQKAIEYDPGYYMAYYQLGKAYEKINDERSALVAYEKFLSTEPEEKDLINEVQKKVIALGTKYY